MPTVHAPTFFSQPVQRISARTSSSWINGGHAPDAWDMNPSLVEEASRGRSPKARQPSNRTVRPRLRRCGLPCYLQKMWYEITLYTFRGRKQEISRIQCVSFKGWLQCSTMPCISPSVPD